MDYIPFDEKNLNIISHNDCLDMAFLGYECFDLFFTQEDWSSISQLPKDGLVFFHFSTLLPEFIELAIDSNIPYDKRYMKLISIRNNHEMEMLEQDHLFPDEWEFDIIFEP